MSGKIGMFTKKRGGKIPQTVFWTDEDCVKLIELWQGGAKLSEMQEAFSHYGVISRNMIFGKIWRLRKMLGVESVTVRKPWVEKTRTKREFKRIMQKVSIEEKLTKDEVIEDRIDLRGVPRVLAGNNLGLFSGDFGPAES